MKLLVKLGSTACRLSVWLIALALAVSATAASSPTVFLKSVVQVSTESVSVADVVSSSDSGLIPQDLVLCRTPEFGTVRVLDASLVASILSKNGVNVSLRGPRQITILRAGRPVSIDDLKPLVQSAFKSSGSEAEIANVRLQSSVVLGPDARLELLRLKFDSAVGAYRAWFAAKSSTGKFTFEAIVAIQPGTAPLQVNTNANKANAVRGPLLVRHGQTASMELHGSGFTARVPVLCLEDGQQSALVQVRDINARTTYRAEVMGAGQLRQVETISRPGSPAL